MGIDISNRYIQMSGMVLGSMMEADHRLREFESQMRLRKRLMRDQAMWQSFEEQYGKDEDDELPPVVKK